MARPLSLSAALVALAVPVGLSAPAAAAAAAPGASTTAVAQPPAGTPLEVTIEQLTPSTMPAHGLVRVSGTVTNTDAVPWRLVNVYPFVSAEPMTTTDELAEAVASDPTAAVGERIVEPDRYDTIESIAPGDSEPFTFSVPRRLLQADTPGIYWFGVHALGETDEGRDELADGRARTFLPLVPPSRTGRLATAIVVPLRTRVEYADDGSLADPERWTRVLGPEGRLRALVDFGAAAGNRTVSWVVDPALVDAVRRLAAGNPARTIAANLEPGDPDEVDGEDPEEPDGEPSETSEATTPEEGVVPRSADADAIEGADAAETQALPDDLDDQTTEAAEAARSWLGRLREALGPEDEILSLPYGDLDVAAAAQHDLNAYQEARDRADSAGILGRSTSPGVSSPSGYLTGAAVRTVAPEDIVLTTDKMFGSSPPPVATAAGRRLVVTSSAALAGGPGPDDPLSMVAVRQRLLSEAAVRFLTARRPPLVVQLPPDWVPAASSTFFSGLDVDWLALTSVRAATATTYARPVEMDRLDYPETQTAAELGSANFVAADELTTAGETLQNLLTLNNVVGGEVADQALSSTSYSSRLSPNAARAATERSRAWIDTRLRRVRVRSPVAVTLSSSEGRFAATVRNDLDQPVTVGITTATDDELQIETAELVVVPAEGRSTVLLDASTEQSGIHVVTLELTDTAGNPLGSTTELSIRSAQVSNVIWLFIAGGGLLLFGTITVRLVRRIRASLRDDPEESDVDREAGGDPSADAERQPAGTATR